jgi:hypothetical protein
MIGGAKKNVKNEAKCEMRNMNSDEGLSQDGSIAGPKTKPPIRATAQCPLPDTDVPTGSQITLGGLGRLERRYRSSGATRLADPQAGRAALREKR